MVTDVLTEKVRKEVGPTTQSQRSSQTMWFCVGLKKWNESQHRPKHSGWNVGPRFEQAERVD